MGNYNFRTVRGIDLVKQLRLESVVERRDYFLSKLMFEAIHGFTPDYLSNLITMRFDIHGYNTRSTQNNDVHIPQIKKEIFENSFLVSGGNLWNQLPGDIKDASSKNSFKSRYKSHFYPK